MRALVIFDSNFGNTQKIADAAAGVLKARGVPVSGVSAEDLRGIGLLVVGSPINGWRPSEKTLGFLEGLRAGRPLT